MRHKHVGVWAGVAVLIVALLACNPFSSASNLTGDGQITRLQTQAAETAQASGNQPATAPTPEPTVSVAGRLGERISAQTIALTATQVETSQGTNDATPDADQTFIIVHLNIENLDNSTGLEVDSGDFQLNDGSGNSFDAYSEEITTDQIEDLDLAPSEKATGKIVFQVPSDAKGLHLLYDFNEKHIDIDLGR